MPPQFRDSERANCVRYLRKRDSIRKHQREITLDGGETAERRKTQSRARGFHAREKRIEREFGEKNFLAQLELLRDAPRKLASDAQAVALARAAISRER